MYNGDLEQLRGALGKVSRLAETASINQTLSYVLLELRDAKLSFTGSDGSVEITAQCQVEPQKKAKGSVAEELCVSCRKLNQFLANSVSAQVAFKSADNQLKISDTGSRSRLGLVVMDPAGYPRMEVAEGSDVDLPLPQASLHLVLRRLQSAISQMSHRQNLSGVFFDFRDKVLRLVATDGHRMAVDVLTEIDAAPDAADFILPRRAVQELLRILDAESKEKIMLSAALQQDAARTASFTLPGTRLTAQLIPESFPDYERVFPKADDNPNTLTFARAEMFDAVTLVSSVHDRTGDVVELQAAADSETLEIVAKGNSGKDVARAEIAITGKHGELHSKINSVYLRDLLNSFGADSKGDGDGEPKGAIDKISLAYKDGKEKLLFTPADAKDSTFKYVLMPVR